MSIFASLRSRPKLSIVMIVYDMAREAPRTLRSLATPYQIGLRGEDYEVIVMDNGSPKPLGEAVVRSFGRQFHYHYVRDASKSPAAALNQGVAMSRGSYVGIHIDGARIASPGLLATALGGFRLYDDPVIATLGWHLGPDVQQKSVLKGYSQTEEDRLLDSIAWPADGYRLFQVSTLAQSSSLGYFIAPAESTAMFMRRSTYQALGGYDTALDQAGGGVINRDFFTRALERERSPYVMLLGEGTFHQIHGGASTRSQQESHSLNLRWEEEYRQLRGKPLQRPQRQAVYLGGVPSVSQATLALSLQKLQEESSKG